MVSMAMAGKLCLFAAQSQVSSKHFKRFQRFTLPWCNIQPDVSALWLFATSYEWFFSVAKNVCVLQLGEEQLDLLLPLRSLHAPAGLALRTEWRVGCGTGGKMGGVEAR